MVEGIGRTATVRVMAFTPVPLAGEAANVPFPRTDPYGRGEAPALETGDCVVIVAKEVLVEVILLVRNVVDRELDDDVAAGRVEDNTGVVKGAGPRR